MASDELDERVRESAKAMAIIADEHQRRSLLNASIAPLNVVLRERINHDAVRVLVKSMDWKDGRWTLDVEGSSPYRISGNELPTISAGDTVLLLVNPKDRTAFAYLNEQTRTSNLVYLRNTVRKTALGSAGLAIVGVAILITVFLAVSHESTAGLLTLLYHSPFYLLSVAGAVFLLMLSFFFGFVAAWTGNAADALEIVAFDDQDLALRKLERMQKMPQSRKTTSKS